MTNLGNNLSTVKIIEQIKQIHEVANEGTERADENILVEVIDNVITVTNCNNDYISYLVLLFGKVIVK